MDELTTKQEDDVLEEGRDSSELPDRDETPYADDPTDEELSPEESNIENMVSGACSRESFDNFIRKLKDVVKKQADEILQKAGLSLEEWHDKLPLLDEIDKLAEEFLE